MLRKAFYKKQRAAERSRQLQAYNTAICVVSFLGCALSGKSLPDFSEVFAQKSKAMTEAQLVAAVFELNRQFGGTENFNSGGDSDGRS